MKDFIIFLNEYSVLFELAYKGFLFYYSNKIIKKEKKEKKKKDRK